MARTKVVMIGLKSSVVDFDDWPQLSVETLEAAFRDVHEQLEREGFDAEWCLTDRGETARDVVRETLKRVGPDVVVIGNGVRSDPKLLELFEAVVNEVARSAPGAALAFNTLPFDTPEAVRRALALRD